MSEFFGGSQSATVTGSTFNVSTTYQFMESKAKEPNHENKPKLIRSPPTKVNYTITLNIIQTIASPNHFTIIERTCQQHSYWTESENGECVLNLYNSGTSGMLRFKVLTTGEEFSVAVGVHNYKRWCDIIPNFQDLDQTAMMVHPTYYGGERYGMLWKQLPTFEIFDKKGHKFVLMFNQAEGKQLSATLSISAVA